MPSRSILWLIPKGENAFDNFEGLYVEEKDGCLYWLGKAKDVEGDFRTYKSNIANYAKLIKELSDKDEEWRKYIFTFSIDKAKEKYVVSYKLR